MKNSFLIFDYFKEAFHINRKNKALYYPQISLIFIKLLIFIFFGVNIYTSIGKINKSNLLDFIIQNGLIFLIVLVAYWILSVIIESGLYSMYKECIINDSLSKKDFFYGVNKYSFKFLIGKLIIFFAFIAFLPLYIILGLITMTIGFTAVILVFKIFFSMWKVSIVVDNAGILQSFKNSFQFARNNFIPLLTLQLIHFAFMNTTNRGTIPGNSFSNNSNNLKISNNKIDIEQIIRVVKISLGILIPVISFAIVITALIKMVFDIFFSLSLFVAYNRKFVNYFAFNNLEGK